MSCSRSALPEKCGQCDFSAGMPRTRWCTHNALKRESTQHGQLRVDARRVVGIYGGIEEVGEPYEEKIQWQDLVVTKGSGSDAARLDDAFEPYLKPPSRKTHHIILLFGFFIFGF